MKKRGLLILKHWTWQLIFIASSFSLWANEVKIGISGMEGGDNLITEGSYLSFLMGETSFDLYTFQKQENLFRIHTNLLSISGQFPLKSFGVRYGISFLRNETSLQFKAPYDQYNESEENYNMGWLFGFYHKINLSSSWSLELLWISHLYPAGVSTITLVTGRKETLTMALGHPI